LCQGACCAPTDIHAWLGPCIGPLQFEVSSDVLAAFQADISAPDEQRFRLRPRPDGSARWLANLPQLARDALGRAGVGRITGGELCTVQDASRFFSYRRDGVTGRMLAAIWRTGD
jgi:polyphenol oxidase